MSEVLATEQIAGGASVRQFQSDVLAGLSAFPKQLPCKYLYDKRGSELFDAICELDEYYLTRTELDIMRRYGAEMARQIGGRAMLIEIGSGSSLKTHILLRNLEDPVAYVPVDISRQHLHETARQIQNEYSAIEVLPLCADFTKPLDFPVPRRKPSHRAIYFPGSTIGNLEGTAARAFLGRVAAMCGTGGGLLIGIDLQKDISTIEAAYNDAQGVTAEFNLNLLKRINRELGGDFDLDEFEHYAFYDSQNGRVDIRLVSRRDQTVRVGGREFEFADGEAIHTEYSHKYTIQGFAELAASAGLTLRRYWTDQRKYFGVLHLVRLK